MIWAAHTSIRKMALVVPMAVGMVAAQPAPAPAPLPGPGRELVTADEWKQYAESLRDWGRQWRDLSREFRLAQQHPAAMPAPPSLPAAPDIRFSPGSRSFLGVQVVEVDSERAKALKLKDEVGVEITSVDPESPAEKAGLKRGDVVLEYQGQRVEGTEQFIRLVRETPAGRQVKLSVARNGSTQQLSARIEARKARVFRAGDLFGEGMPTPLRGEMWFPDVPRPITGWRSPRLGVEAESLSGQLAAYFGVKEGVLVRSVNKGSPAEAAGFKAGDVITKVDQKALNSASDLSSLLRSARGKKTLPFTVVREKREMTLTVALTEETGSAGSPAPPERPGPAAVAPAPPAPPPSPARSINRRDEF